MATYRETANNDTFLDAARTSLLALGEEDPGFDRKNIIDAFLRKKRFFDTNLISTIGVSKAVESMSQEQRASFGYALDQAEQIPALGDGSAPKLNALLDYGTAIVSDPINTIGVVAGVFTAGSSLAATTATRAAAKQGVKGVLSSKVSALIPSTAVKPLIVESAIFGAAGTARSLTAQGVEKDVNLREETSVPRALASGLIEGPASVVGGAVLAKGLSATGTKLDTLITEGKLGQGAYTASTWMKNTFLTKSLADENLTRIAEQTSGFLNTIERKTRDHGRALDAAIKRNFTNQEEGIDLVNKAMEGNKDAFAKLPDAVAAEVATGRDLITEISDYSLNLRVRNPDYDPNVAGSEKFIELLDPVFKRNFMSNDTYARNVYKTFLKPSEKTPSNFNQLMKDGTVVQEISEIIATKPDWVDNLPKSALTGINKNALKRRDDVAMQKLARNFFDNAKGRFRITGSLQARVVLEGFQKKLWGKNYSPGQRFIQSVAGISSAINRTAFGASAADSLLTRGIGIQSKTASQAAEAYAEQQKKLLGFSDEAYEDYLATNPSQRLFKEDFVPVIGEGTNSLIRVESNRITAEASSVWIPRTVAERLKPAVTQFSDKETIFGNAGFGAVLNQVARAQGAIKIGKVPLSPVGILRNAIGASLAVVGSGNIKGALLVTKTLSKTQREALFDRVKRLGVTSTSVEIGQILVRLGRDIDADPTMMEKIFSGGLAAAFPRTYNRALEFYGNIDDFSKIATFLGELDHHTKLWKAMTPAQRKAKTDEIKGSLPTKFAEGPIEEVPPQRFRPEQIKGDKTILQYGGGKTSFESTEFARQGVEVPYTDEDIIQELATRATLRLMPVYNRAPAIIDAMRRVPILGNFSTYPAEVFRNAYNILKTTADELTEGFAMGGEAGNILIKRALTRQASFYGLASSPFVIAAAMNDTNGHTDKIESVRKLAMPWHKYGALVVTDIVDAPNGDKEVKYMDLSYSNPYAPLTSVIAPMVIEGASGGDPNAVLAEGLPKAAAQFLSPFTDPSLILQASTSLVNLATGDGGARDINNLMNSITPTFVNHVIDVSADAGLFKSDQPLFLDSGSSLQDLDKILINKAYGQGYNPPKDVSEIGKAFAEKGYNITGLSEHKLSMKASTGYALKHLKKTEDQERIEWRRSIAQTLEDPAREINSQKILADYEKVLQTNFALQDGKVELLDDLINIIGEKEAKKIFLSGDAKSGSKAERFSLAAKDPRSVIYRFSTDRTYLRSLFRRPQIRNNPERRRQIQALLFDMRAIENKYDRRRIYDGVPD